MKKLFTFILLLFSFFLYPQSRTVTTQGLTATQLVFGNGSSTVITIPNGVTNTVLVSNGLNSIASWQAITNIAWGINGNSILSTNFIGSTNNQPITFKVNNTFAGKIGTTADSNLFLGLNAGLASTTTLTNVALGIGSFQNSNGSSAKWNVAIGPGTLGGSNTTGSTAIGYMAGHNDDNGYNFYGGLYAGYINSGGIGNVDVGRYAGEFNAGSNGNTDIGDMACRNGTGGYNTIIGFNGLPTLVAGSGNSALGTNIDVKTASISNSSALGDSVLIRNSNGVYLGLRDTALYLANMCFVKDSVTGGSTPVHNYAYPTAGQTLIFYGKNKGFGFGSSGSAYTADESSLHLAGGVFSIKSTYVGQTSITTLGTIGTGTWGTGAIIGGATMTLGSDANYDTYYRNSSGVLTRLANGTTGQVYTATTGAAPGWAAAAPSTYDFASQTITGAGTTTIAGGSVAFKNLSATSNATATTIAYSGFANGELVTLHYLKTTASNMVITFPAGTELSQSALTAGTISGLTLTLNSTTSGSYTFWIQYDNIDALYLVTGVQNVN